MEKTRRVSGLMLATASPKRCFGNRHVEVHRVNRDGRLPERIVDGCSERNSLAVDITVVCECHRLAHVPQRHGMPLVYATA
jgi:hypothetical protein